MKIMRRPGKSLNIYNLEKVNTYIIAEMAWGHTGSIEIAKKILIGAKHAGANAIGVHLTYLPDYMTPEYKCIAGQTLSDSADTTESIYKYLEKIDLSREDWLKFSNEAQKLGIDIIAMCNDLNSYEFSKGLHVKQYVISAASFVEYNFIRAIVENVQSIILRIGGATFSELENVVKYILTVNKNIEIVLLAGIQLYPTPIEQMHINSISTLKKHFKQTNLTFGLADHIDGNHPYSQYLPALALPLGIKYIEKHITTERDEKLEDYEAAIGINQFVDFVKFIRAAEDALGDGSINYLQNDSNEKYRQVVRKKIVAKCTIKPGDIISLSNIVFKRADYGESLEYLDNVVGKTVLVDIKENEGITLGKLK